LIMVVRRGCHADSPARLSQLDDAGLDHLAYRNISRSYGDYARLRSLTCRGSKSPPPGGLIRKSRVVVVGDHPQLLDALVDLVSEEPDLELIGVAGNGEEALSLARSTESAVFLFDLEAVGVDPGSVIYDLNQHEPTVRLIALSSYDDADAVRRSQDAGFHRHVSKIFGIADLLTILLEEHVRPA
jgi:CheY-like chemotaxis protein